MGAPSEFASGQSNGSVSCGALELISKAECGVVIVHIGSTVPNWRTSVHLLLCRRRVKLYTVSMLETTASLSIPYVFLIKFARSICVGQAAVVLASAKPCMLTYVAW